MQVWNGLSASRHKDPELRNDIMEIDRFLHEVSDGFGRLSRNQLPISSGVEIGNNGALNDYFYLPGRPGGQVAYGGTLNGDQITLIGSTTSALPTNGALSTVRVVLPSGGTSASSGFAVEDTLGNKLADISANGSLTLDDPTSYSSGNPIMLDLHCTTASSASTMFRMRSGVNTTLSVSYNGATTISMRQNSTALTLSGFGGAANIQGWNNGGGTLSFIDSTGAFNGPLVATTASVIDNAFSILDNLDPTKIAQFQAASISAGTTRTFTFPDASMTLAGIDKAQTFSQPQIIQGSATTDIPLIVRGVSGQTGHLFDIQSFTPTALAYFDANGILNLHRTGLAIWGNNTTPGLGFAGTFAGAASLFTASRTFTLPDYTGQVVLRITAVNRTGIAASTAAANLISTAAAVGNQVYFVSCYVVCTTASGLVGDTIQVNITWTDPSGTAQTTAIAGTTGSAVGNKQQGTYTLFGNSGVAVQYNTVVAGGGTSVWNAYLRVSTL